MSGTRAPARELNSWQWAPGAVSICVVMVATELASRAGVLPTTEFPPLSSDLRALAGQLTEPALWAATGNTLLGWCAGLGIAIAIAIPLGLLIGTLPLLYRATRVVVEFCRPVPSVAILPLVVLVFGPDLQGKIFLIVFACVWPLLVQTIYGIQDIDQVALDTARVYRLGRLRSFWHVSLPSALPYIMTGVRISSSIALVLAITTEMVIGVPGLGSEIVLSHSVANYDDMYGLIILTGVIGLLLNALVRVSEYWLLAWHPSQRRKVGSR